MLPTAAGCGIVTLVSDERQEVLSMKPSKKHLLELEYFVDTNL